MGVSADYPLKKPDRELNYGEILSQSFHLYQSNFIAFLLPFLAAGILVGLFSSSLSTVMPFDLSSLDSLVSIIRWGTLSGIVSWVVNTVANSISVNLTTEILEKKGANLKSSFNFTLSKLVSLLAVAAITGILFIIGFICLVIPGIILGIMFSLVVPVVMIEGVGALNSLGRSRKLVSKRWGRTFIVLIIVLTIQGMMSGIVTGIVPSTSWSSLISNLLMALVQPLMPIALTFLYYSMKVKETQEVVGQTELLKETRYCPYCGIPVTPNAVFCQNCGKKIIPK
jgi:hypothetical protein